MAQFHHFSLTFSEFLDWHSKTVQWTSREWKWTPFSNETVCCEWTIVPTCTQSKSCLVHAFCFRNGRNVCTASAEWVSSAETKWLLYSIFVWALVIYTYTGQAGITGAQKHTTGPKWPINPDCEQTRSFILRFLPIAIDIYAVTSWSDPLPA